MLLFGHVGITLGAATLVNGAINNRHSKTSWFASLSRYIDIRFLLVGSLLPDIIDKPVGQYILRDTFSNGRIFSHSLLFLVLISAAGFYLYKRHRQVWMLPLAIGTFTHLVFDEMWNAPATLFWPLLGFTFEKIELTDWLSNIFRELFSNPRVYIPEIVGLAILLWFGLVLVRRKKVGVFIKYGKVS
jgi:inner membrane protein